VGDEIRLSEGSARELLAEAGEVVQAIAGGFAAIDEQRTRGAPNPDRLNEVFRAAVSRDIGTEGRALSLGANARITKPFTALLTSVGSPPGLVFRPIPASNARSDQRGQPSASPWPRTKSAAPDVINRHEKRCKAPQVISKMKELLRLGRAKRAS
jgi:hypothetical protein